MGRERYTNALATLLNGAINNSVTTVTVDDASTFPTAYFRLICESEIMFCTSRASNVLTVVRAQEGTAAASHADNTPINHIVTAGTLDEYRKGILGDCGLVPFEDSLSADDDNFDDESFSGWTAVNTTPALTAAVEKNHRYSVVTPTGTANAQYYSWVKTKTPGAGGYVQVGFQLGGSGTQYPIPAVIMANGNTYGAGKQIMWGWSPHEKATILRSMTGYNTDGAANNYITIESYPPIMHLRLVWNSNDNYTGLVSADGIGWAIIFTGVSLGSMGAAPTHMGFGITSWGASREFNFSALYCRFNF